MKKNIIIFSVLFISLIFSSCKKEPSVQGYIIDSENKPGFLSLNLTGSMLPVSEDTPEETKKALQTVKKINLTALPVEGNETNYKLEKEKLKLLMQNSEYKELMRFSEKNAKIRLYYLGDKNNLNEFIVLGYDNSKGLGIARVLGKNMQPGALLKAMKELKIDGDNGLGKKIKAVFGAK